MQSMQSIYDLRHLEPREAAFEHCLSTDLAGVLSKLPNILLLLRNDFMASEVVRPLYDSCGRLAESLETDEQARRFLFHVHSLRPHPIPEDRLNTAKDKSRMTRKEWERKNWARRRTRLSRLKLVAQRFPGAYLEHIASCSQRCGSVPLFTSCVKKVQDPEALHHAMTVLRAMPGKTARDSFVKLRRGLMDLVAPQVAKVAEEASRTLLMRRMVHLCTAPVGFGREPPLASPAAWHLLTDLSDLHLAELTGDLLVKAQQHSEQRILWFFLLCSAVYRDGHRYRVGDTYLQDSNGTEKNHACHSSCITCLDRYRPEDRVWLMAKFREVFDDCTFLHEINTTVVLPSQCNNIDSQVDGTRGSQGLRDDAIPLVNACAKGTLLPDEATTQFACALVARLRIIQPSTTSSLQIEYITLQIEVARQLFDGEDPLAHRYFERQVALHLPEGMSEPNWWATVDDKEALAREFGQGLRETKVKRTS